MSAVASPITNLYCLPNHLFRRRSKKTSKLLVIGLCEGNPPVTGGLPHKGPVTRKMFAFDDVIMWSKFHKRLESWFPNNAIGFRFDVDFKANMKLKIYPDMHGYNLDCVTFTTTGRENKSCLYFPYIYSLWSIDPYYWRALHLHLFPWTTWYSEVFSTTQAVIVGSVGVRCHVNYYISISCTFHIQIIIYLYSWHIVAI